MTSVELEYRAQVLRTTFRTLLWCFWIFLISKSQYAFIIIAQKNGQHIIKTFSFLSSTEKRSKRSFLSVLILKNEAEKTDKQLADIKDEDKKEWDTLIFERNTRRTLGLSECAWQTGCSTALNTAVIQNTWNTCFYLGSLSEQEHIFHSCSLVYGNFNPFKSHFGNMRCLKKRMRMKHRPQKRGKSAWGKNNMLTNGFAKKALQNIRTCRWSQTRYTNRRVWSDSIFPGGFSD